MLSVHSLTFLLLFWWRQHHIPVDSCQEPCQLQQQKNKQKWWRDELLEKMWMAQPIDRHENLKRDFNNHHVINWNTYISLMLYLLLSWSFKFLGNPPLIWEASKTLIDSHSHISPHCHACQLSSKATHRLVQHNFRIVTRLQTTNMSEEKNLTNYLLRIFGNYFEKAFIVDVQDWTKRRSQWRRDASGNVCGRKRKLTLKAEK